jgi:hypothetical protein
MRRWALLLVGALAACARGVGAAPSDAPAPEPAAHAAAPKPQRADPEASARAWDRARAIVAAAKVTSSWSVDEATAEALSRAGLDEELAIAALSALAERCEAAGGWSACGLDDDEERDRDVLLRWLGAIGSEAAIPTLLSLDSQSLFAAGMALERVLVARASAAPPSCTPPTPEEVAAVRATLHDFAVVEPVGGRLGARALAPGEADDLAYFLAAVADSGPEVGTEDRTHRSGATPEPEDVAWRVATLEKIAAAREEGNAAAMFEYGTRYLQSLGHPGSIDLDLEAEHAWGGARFSYVMRDVALAAEIVGEPGLAADLYRRANPGGGACGTSVDYRRGEQLQGLVRAADMAGRCGATVPERLMDWEGQAGSFYGPERLVDAGFDLERLYRGAFVTRHRDIEPEELKRAIERAPADLRAAALARVRDRGPEAWEARVWTVEGVADELGPRGVEILQTKLPLTAGSLRARTIRAIGDAARRTFMGPCPDDVLWLEGMGGSVWSRPVAMYGTDCSTRPSDAQADALHARLAPSLRDGDEVTIATITALASIAAPRSIPVLKRVHARSSAALSRCRRDPDRDCEAEQRLFDASDDATRRLADIRTRG